MTTHLNNQEIYERIYAAINERRLPPGTKLSEERLAQAFHVSRTRIHEILMRLSHELVVELHLNRGAFVASPTPRDLRDVFAVRRALERAVVIELSEKFAGQTIPALHAHIDSEAKARAASEKIVLARLTGEFHVRLAEITENRLYSDNLRRLVTLTGLAIAQYDSLASSACPQHEHADIVAAIESGDARRAERVMHEHLDHVERGIQIPITGSDEIDFEQIFQLGKKVAVTEVRVDGRKKKKIA
jgi:DNA-binding GntR family transcriptional regulator